MSNSPPPSAPEDKDSEHYRLAGRPPLKTIIILSIGPLLSQLSSALFGVVDTMWVSKGVGTRGVSAISTYSPFDNLGRSFGYFVQVASSSQISSLFGQRKGEEAPQVMVDMLRIAIICGCFVPAAILPWVRSVAKWVGADDSIVADGFRYISVTLGGATASCLYMCICGCLQGEGRTMVNGIANVCSCLVNALIFDPILILHTSLGVEGAAISTFLSECLPMIVLFSCYFAGKFTIKPKFSQFIQPFNPRTLIACKVGFSQLISQLSMCIPAIFLLYFTGRSSGSDTIYVATTSVNNVIFRLVQFNLCVILAVALGYIPSASYAYARHDKERWKWLTIHATWITSAWGCTVASIEVGAPRAIATMFSGDTLYLWYAQYMIRFGTSGFYLASLRIICIAILQSMQKGLQATILSLVSQFLSLLGFAIMWYYIFPHDPRYLELSYPCSFIFSAIMGSLMIWKPIKTFLNSEEKVGDGFHDEKGEEKPKSVESSKQQKEDEKLEERPPIEV